VSQALAGEHKLGGGGDSTRREQSSGVYDAGAAPGKSGCPPPYAGSSKSCFV